jgi:hypothetical protein
MSIIFTNFYNFVFSTSLLAETKVMAANFMTTSLGYKCFYLYTKLGWRDPTNFLAIFL